MSDSFARLVSALAGRYTVERELGRGGMATVYLARDLKHDRQVAIKVLHPELAAVLGGDRFVQEIKVTANLQHPHILALHDSGAAEGLLYYVMPFVEGESLRGRLDRESQIPIGDAIGILRNVASALDYAHRQGVVHRDIKPENILLEEGEAMVADFGIALAMAHVESERLTATGVAVGTPAYMSPEQITGETVDGRSDIYALGCLLYEMVTGQPPFSGATPQAVLAQSMVGEPAPASRGRTDLPHEFDTALAKALAKDPGARFVTAGEFAEAVTPPPARLQARRWPIAVAAVVAIVAIAALIPLWQSRQQAQARDLVPQVSALADQGRFVEAYALAVRAERRIPGDSALARSFPAVSDHITVTSDPAGARVTLSRFSGDVDAPFADSVDLGLTPIEDHRLPRADYRVTIELDGFVPVERIASTGLDRQVPSDKGPFRADITVTLAPTDEVPDGMVPVPGGRYQVASPDMPIGLAADLDDYYIDRHEVTQSAFRDFVRAGGYGDPRHWAPQTGDRSSMVDRTGLPAPREWISQDFPAGLERHPVTGVSWYEAAAYCTSIGRRLPTIFEWEKAARDGIKTFRGVMMPWGFMSSVRPSGSRANFNSGGTTDVDAFPFGISPYGAYDMAGNVKEWTANPMGRGYMVTGGSWQDPMYLYSEFGEFPATFQSPALGFRCAGSRSAASGDQGAGPLDLDQRTPVYHPVDESTYRSLLTHYRYDRTPLNAQIVETREAPDWVRHLVTFSGVDADTILAYLYLPTQAAPPFQPIVYVPSGAAFFGSMVWENVEQMVASHIKAGRAVLAVVLRGMTGRPWDPGYTPPASNSVRFRDEMVLQATELRRGIDYLETRDDIDMTRLIYVGVSYGAGSRLAFAAVDDRYRAVVLIGAGIDERSHPTLPEALNVNFAPYIEAPKLVVNGQQDEEHPWYTRGLPLWTLLKEPKDLVLVEGGGHFPPDEARVPAINRWLDETVGPVTPKQE